MNSLTLFYIIRVVTSILIGRRDQICALLCL